MCAYPSLTTNASWFDIRVESGRAIRSSSPLRSTPLPGGKRLAPPEFSIELISPLADGNSSELIGVPDWLAIKDRNGEKRLVHGVIRAMEPRVPVPGDYG